VYVRAEPVLCPSGHGRRSASSEAGRVRIRRYLAVVTKPADEYDNMVQYASHLPETDATVAGLLRLAPADGRILELGVGTGRLAIPLAEAGREVHGVELDAEMIDGLRSKPGGDRVQVHLGDMALPVDAGSFDLIFIAFGTLFSLPTQEDQLRCFVAAADQLTERGRFLVEALVPQPGSYVDGQKTNVSQVDEDAVILTASIIDPAEQVLWTQQVVFTDGSVKLFPNRIRYAWPAELDLMARIAGLRLSARWADWTGTAFDAQSVRHISVYER
jgi:SAM-dependent methyltransferase